MKISKMDGLTFKNATYSLRIDPASGKWWIGPAGEESMLSCRGALMLVPAITGCRAGNGIIEDCGIKPGGARLIRLTASISGTISGEVENRLWLLEDRIVCESSYRCGGNHLLEHWLLSDDGGQIDAEHAHAFCGVHAARDNNGTLWDASSGLDISTATHNWMYANAMPRLLLRHDGWNLLIGGTSPANDFGLELKSEGHSLQHLRFNYGGSEFPWERSGNSTVPGPRLQIQLSRLDRHEAAHALFTEAIICDGLAERRRHAPEESSWRRPWYCTWGDQMAIAKSALRQEQAGHAEYSAIKDVLTQEFVLKAAKFIRNNSLDIGTIIIDDGWQDKRGDWNLNTANFPDMRGLVDELHSMDFKVAVWFAPFLTEPDAKVCARPGFTSLTSRHNQTVLDYTNPEVRNWLSKKLDLWFSSGPQGWDIDGLKLDFLLEKVYANAGRTADPEWRGEERLYSSLFHHFERHIRRHKPVPGLLHAPYNVHWMESCASLYGEERFDRDLEYLASRPSLIEAVAPGAWMSPHFNYNSELVPEFLRRVKAIGGIPQIGKLLAPEIPPELIAEIRSILADR